MTWRYRHLLTLLSWPVQVHASSAMDVLAQDYIKTARAKGLPERLVLLRHLVRNAFLPMITLVGLSIPALLAGNLIAESSTRAWARCSSTASGTRTIRC